MNPAQLRETTIHPDTRRLVQLTVDAGRKNRRRDGHAVSEKACP